MPEPLSAATRTLAVVDGLALYRRLQRIAERAGLLRSTAHNILAQLIEGGWVEHPERGLYRPAGRLRVVAGAILRPPRLTRALTLGGDQAATGRMLLGQQRCYAACLFAIDDEAHGCSCHRCGGRWHGALAYLLDQPVDGAPRRIAPRLPGEDPDQLTAFDPELVGVGAMDG